MPSDAWARLAESMLGKPTLTSSFTAITPRSKLKS